MGILRGHRQQLGRLIENYNCIVLEKDVKLPPILLSRTATALGWKFLHCRMADRAFTGRLRKPSDEAALDDPSLCYQHPGRLTGKPEGLLSEILFWRVGRSSSGGDRWRLNIWRINIWRLNGPKRSSGFNLAANPPKTNRWTNCFQHNVSALPKSPPSGPALVLATLPLVLL